MHAEREDPSLEFILHWGIILLLTFLFHLGIFLMKWSWLMPPPLSRVEVVPIPMEQIDRIRENWKKINPQGFLLKTDPQMPAAKEAAPDTRYFSDRTVRVTKEQRAAITQVLPRPAARARPASPAQTQTKSQRQKFSLADAGFPYSFQPVPAPRPAPPVPLQPGGDQALSEKSLPVGEQNLLNTQESIYYSFYARIYESIGPVWQSKTRETTSRRPLKPGEYVTVVEVRLTTDGELHSLRTLRSSGVPELNQDVESSWNRFKRFPNPPQALLQPDGLLHMVWTFTVHVGEGSSWEYLPPERIPD